MNITIHRGINQIGGCITELYTATSRIFIDMGDNLPGENDLTDGEKRSFVNSLFANNIKKHGAVVYTHAHPDHIGMMAYVPMSVPQYEVI
ncbi:MAG: hypothetical protein NC301_05750 [Bacteroides sp.]|nr:hypothetical protein [Bacteroides sp.]MCM1379223.1 hypothetical protein [Bacteroides sp.]MCM1445119.1 hypothetical protein [Prevotella sp.]